MIVVFNLTWEMLSFFENTRKASKEQPLDIFLNGIQCKVSLPYILPEFAYFPMIIRSYNFRKG